MLAQGSLSSGEIAARFDISAPAVSQHLQGPASTRAWCGSEPRPSAASTSWIGRESRSCPDGSARIQSFWNRKLDVLEQLLKAGAIMSNRGESLRVLAVRFVRPLPGPTERVWEYLTDCRKLSAWFGDDGQIEPREGGAIRFMQGHVRGVVTQWKPQRRLAYTWNVFGPVRRTRRIRNRI